MTYIFFDCSCCVFESIIKSIQSRNMDSMQYYRRYWQDLKRYKRARRPCPQPDEKACCGRCTRVGVHARSRWFVHPIDHILLWLLLSSYCGTCISRMNPYARKNAVIRTTSLNAIFRIICSARVFSTRVSSCNETSRD